MSGPGVTVPHGALLTAASAVPFLIPTPFLALGEVSLFGNWALHLWGPQLPGIQPSGPGERPTLAWRERKQTEKGKGRVNKAMLPTRWQRVPRRAQAGSRLRPQSVPISQDRGSHGVVLHPQHPPHLGTCLEMLVFLDSPAGNGGVRCDAKDCHQ